MKKFKKTIIVILTLIMTVSLNINTCVYAAWQDYLGFDGKPGHTWFEAADGKVSNVTETGWTVDLVCIGHYLWGAQMTSNNIPFISFGKKYQIHYTLKSTNCDKWVLIKISNAYGKWIKLKKGKSTTINEIFTAQANAWEKIEFAFGGEYGDGDQLFNMDYSLASGGKTFIAANPDPEPTTSTTISCSDFYLGPVISKTSLSKIKRSGNKAKITMKKVKNIQGYQIQYSTSKKFKAKKTKTVTTKKSTYTIKKLKKNTKYYVRVRPYKKISKAKIYGNWSKLKTIAKK